MADDFFGKTSELFNNLVDSIEKGVEDLKNDVKDRKNAKRDSKSTESKPRQFGQDLFRKAPEAKTTTVVKNKVPGFPSCRVDTFESIKIFCDIPGCDKSALKLDYEKDTLVVRAKREEPSFGDEKVTFRDDSRTYGNLEKRFRVGSVEADSIHASFKDGVLTITCKRVKNNGGVGINID